MSVFTRALFALILGAGLLLGAAACDSTNDENPALLRVVHATPGLDAIDFLIDFDLFTRNLFFRVASPYLRWDPGLRRLEARAAGNPNALVTQDVILNEDIIYTVLVTGTSDAPALLVLQDDRSMPPAGQARVRVVHVAPNFGSLNVTMRQERSPPTFDLFLAFGASSTYISIDPGAYDIEAHATDGSGGPAILTQDIETGLRYLIVVTNTAVFTVADG